MKTAGRLALGVLAWVTVVPLGLLCLWLSTFVFGFPEASRTIMYVTDAINIGTAALLYWYAVPSVPHWGRRVAYFVGFVVLLVVASAVVTFGVQLLIAMLLTFRR